MEFDAHERPPENLRLNFKQLQKLSNRAVLEDQNIVDFAASNYDKNHFQECVWPVSRPLKDVFATFCGTDSPFWSDASDKEASSQAFENSGLCAFSCKELPSLFIIPSMIPISVQKVMLARIFHRDLSNGVHNTNVHFHHNMEYPTNGRSFFDFKPTTSGMIEPKCSDTHRPMTIGQFLNKKLRWLLLGGQYLWTEKRYPSGLPPDFPEDLSVLLQDLFPQTKPEAAIVNLYSPGDTLSLHRDVSENCGNGLISLSIGCDALFIVGLDATSPQFTFRLRSGDVLYMDGESRYAWHGVPKIIPDTCPNDLRAWPGVDKEMDLQDPPDYHQDWTDWMATKRINLNVRQMQ